MRRRFFLSDDEPTPKGAYAISKFEAEQALFQVSHDTGLEVVIIRPIDLWADSKWQLFIIEAMREKGSSTAGCNK